MMINPYFFNIGTAPWIPTDETGLKVWLKSSDISTITKDAGDLVSQWNDKSGNGNNAIQTVSTKKAKWFSAVQNGKDIIRFDGVNDTMKIVNLSLPAQISIFVAGKFTLAKDLFIEHGVSISTEDGFYIYGHGAHATNFRRTTTHFSASSPVDWMGSAATCVSSRYDGVAAPEVIKGGVEISYGTRSGSTANNDSKTRTLFICSRNESSLFSEGDLYEIVIYDKYVSTAVMDNIKTYFENEWGL